MKGNKPHETACRVKDLRDLLNKTVPSLYTLLSQLEKSVAAKNQAVHAPDLRRRKIVAIIDGPLFEVKAYVSHRRFRK